jgi:hypothetical protein
VGAGETPVLVHNDDKICVTEAISQDILLTKEALKAQKDESVKRELSGLQRQLAIGNTSAGLESGRLSDGISYLRGRNGARLFYRRTASGLEVVGMSSKKNEQKVINRLGQIYG